MSTAGVEQRQRKAAENVPLRTIVVTGITFAASIIAAVASNGTSLLATAAAGAATGVSLTGGAYLASETIADYSRDRAESTTLFSRGEVISAADLSSFWVGLAIAGVALDLTGAVRLFGQLGPEVRALPGAARAGRNGCRGFCTGWRGRRCGCSPGRGRPDAAAMAVPPAPPPSPPVGPPGVTVVEHPPRPVLYIPAPPVPPPTGPLTAAEIDEAFRLPGERYRPGLGDRLRMWYRRFSRPAADRAAQAAESARPISALFGAFTTAYTAAAQRRLVELLGEDINALFRGLPERVFELSVAGARDAAHSNPQLFNTQLYNALISDPAFYNSMVRGLAGGAAPQIVFLRSGMQLDDFVSFLGP